jgi:hypothetical protein
MAHPLNKMSFLYDVSAHIDVFHKSVRSMKSTASIAWNSSKLKALSMPKYKGSIKLTSFNFFIFLNASNQ